MEQAFRTDQRQKLYSLSQGPRDRAGLSLPVSLIPGESLDKNFKAQGEPPFWGEPFVFICLFCVLQVGRAGEQGIYIAAKVLEIFTPSPTPCVPFTKSAGDQMGFRAQSFQILKYLHIYNGAWILW